MTDLPDDIEQLKAMLLAKEALLHDKEEEISALKNHVQLLIEQLNLSQSKRFAAQSEKSGERHLQRSRAARYVTLSA